MSKDLAQPEVGTLTHEYAASGTYTVTIADESDSSRKVVRTVIVPFGLLLNAVRDLADLDRRSVNITTDNAGRGSVTINWGDGTTVSSSPGDGTTISKHKYAGGGTYTITATDADDPSRTTTTTVTTPFPIPPTVVVTQAGSDADKMSVNVTVDNLLRGAVTIDWGDGSSTTSNVGDGAAISLHKYVEEGTYTITVTDSDNSEIFTTKTQAVPFPSAPALTLNVAESSPPGSPRRKITVTWDNQGQGPVKILFGEPSVGEVATNGAESGSVDHTYAASGTYTVTVRDATNAARVQTTPVTVPFTV